VAVAAAGSFVDVVGEVREAVGIAGELTASFLTPLTLGLGCWTGSFFVTVLFSASFFIASRASLACFADSITPLILAGPPLMNDFTPAGEFGVLGDDFSSCGDLGEATGDGLTMGLG
jgi:hypothetical protein